MPVVKMPDGTFVDMPEKLTPEMREKLQAVIAKQGEPKKEEPKPDPANRDTLFQLGNINKGIAGALGAPVDIAQDVVNLGKASAGMAASVAGRPDLMPEVRNDAIGGSKWFENLMQQHRMITDSAKPKNLSEKIAAGVLQGAGNLLGGTAATGGAVRAASKVENLIKNPPAEGIVPGRDVRADTMRELRKEGYAFPPSQANPSAVNRVVEGAASKRATAQEISIKNQEVDNKLAKRDLGVSQNTPLNEETVQLVRDDAQASYDKVRGFDGIVKPNTKYLKEMGSLNGEFAALEKKFPGLTKNEEVDQLKALLTNQKFVEEGMSASDAIDLTRLLREKATANFKAASAPGGKAEVLALAQAQRDAAAHVEDLLATTLKAAGKESLYKEYVAARKSFAISYDIESILNPATGNVSGSGAAGLARKGRPLTGGLAKIAKYAQAFPKGAQSPEKIGGVPEGFVDMMLTSMGAAGGSHAGGVEGSMAGAAAGMAARPALRKLLLSDLYQDNFVVPKGR